MNIDLKRKKNRHLYIFLYVLPFVWSRDNRLKFRIVLSAFFVIFTILLNVSTPLVFKETVHNLSYNSQSNLILLLMISYGLMWLTAQVMTHLREIIMFRVIEHASCKLNFKVFSHLLNLPLHFHVNRKTGAIVSAIERAQKSIPQLVWGIFFYFVPTIVELICASTILFKLYEPGYGLILISTFVLYTFYTIIFSKKAVKAQQMSNEQQSKLGARSLDSLMNFESIIYFNNQEYELNKQTIYLKNLEDARTKAQVSMSYIFMGQNTIIGLAILLLTWITGQKVIEGALEVSDFVLINVYLLQFSLPLSFLGQIFKNVREAIINLETVLEFLEEKNIATYSYNKNSFNYSMGEIKFENVCFGYKNRPCILNNLSFSIPAGKTIAIVGPTGSGKSSLIKLLLRAYDTNAGKIMIDGQNIEEIPHDYLRSLFSVVTQDSLLFNDTIFNNIIYGKPDATREEVEVAAHKACLSELINSLPKGYDTFIGEKGIKLSGGEKQRIAIARAVLRKPKIYLFDEATAALDMKTERIIQNNLREISSGSTTIIVAHRLSTIVDASIIFVLDKGIIVESGKHNYLLNNNGWYAELWKKQNSEVEEYEHALRMQFEKVTT